MLKLYKLEGKDKLVAFGKLAICLLEDLLAFSRLGRDCLNGQV
jgi:hypothetical protein